MTPIDGRRNPKGDAWGKRIPKLNQRRGCLTVLIPLSPGRRVSPRTLPRAAGRPVATSTPAGRSAQGRAS